MVILQQRSLRALRKLLIAFRAAVHMNDEDSEQAWTIDSSASMLSYFYYTT
jgi:nucleolar complex protein 2